MNEQTYEFSYAVYSHIDELGKQDAELLREARAITEAAYAPYSKFQVGAAALLANGEIVRGTNQENASYPVGTCAERALLATASTLFPGMPIEAMAVSYNNLNQPGNSNHPVSPCGMCRQALLEFENRTGKTIRLILGGQEGKIYIIEKSSQLLPLGFNSAELK
jgi:cytidine deaminase